MKGNREIIAHLNKCLRNELTAINQYFLHGRMQKDWGFNELGDHTYRESIEEMQHADKLIVRILFLEGLPNLQDLGKLSIGETVPEQLENDLALERGARDDLVAAVEFCEQQRDYVSRDLLQEILNDAEEHIDMLETQVGLIEKLGVQNYLQSAKGALDDAAEAD